MGGTPTGWTARATIPVTAHDRVLFGVSSTLRRYDLAVLPRRLTMFRWAIGALALVCATVGCSPGKRPADELTFAGATVRIIVGSAPGGTHDLHARLVASHLGRHLPGLPRVIVENMPGAGGRWRPTTSP